MRRLIGAPSQKQERKTPAPLEKENSKRRSFAFLSYSPDQRASTASMKRTREQHKQIAKAVSSSRSIESTTNQVPMTPKSKLSPTESSDSFSIATSSIGSATGFFEDPKERRHIKSPLELFVEKHQGSGRLESVMSDSSEGRRRNLEDKSINSMPILSSNSTMNARNSLNSSSSINSMPTLPSNSTMNARNLHNSSGSGTTTAISAGAAARRRARRQQEPTGSNSDLGIGDCQETPSSSPYSMNRSLSNTSASSNVSRGSVGRSQNLTNHLTNYAQTPRAAIDYPSGVSVNSHETSETNLFLTSFDYQGFTFDAFGLDEQVVDEEVSLAIQELQSTSLFYQDEFPPQSFDSPAGSVADDSRSSTPVDEDGFENGFRVTVPTMMSASPVPSDPSSLTEWTDKKDGIGRRNIFKEEAGWSGNSTKRIPPSDANWADFGIYRTSPSSIPNMAQSQFETGNRSDVGGRSDVDVPSSTGAPSDMAIQSDVGVNSEIRMRLDDDDDELEIPIEVTGKKNKKSQELFEEKKEEVVVTPSDKSDASLKQKWEHSQSRKKEGTNALRRSNPAPWQANDNLIGKSKNLRSVQKEVVSEQQKRVQECTQQRKSLSSHRERLKPTHLRVDIPSSKSDVMESFRMSTGTISVSSLLRGYEQTQSSARESQSDIGQSVFPSGVKLRNTSWVSKFESPSQQQPQHHDDIEWQDLGSDQKDDDHYDKEHHHEPDKSSLTHQGHREMELRKQQPVVEKYESDSETEKAPPQNQARKLTYREIREGQLREQREEERRKKAEEETKTSKSLDVAALIRKRIAANKQKASMVKDNGFGDVEADSGIQTFNGLKKISMGSKITQFRAPVVRPSEQSSAYKSHDELDASYSQTPDSHQVNLAATEPMNPLHGACGVPAITASPHYQQSSDPPIKDDELPARPTTQSLFANRSLTMGPPPPSEDSQGAPTLVSISASAEDTKKQLNAFFANRLAKGPQPRVNEAKESNLAISSVPSHSMTEVAGSLAFASEEPPASDDSRPALKDDQKYDRYFRMLKVGMPLEVVKHAMTRDGVDPSVMDGDHNKPAGFGSGPSLRDDPKYEKYFKMLKMGLPMGAVQNAMERDGIDPSIMERDHDLPANVNGASKEGVLSMENLPKDTHRRTRLHWDTLRKVRSNSLWAKINQDKELEDIDIDEDEFEQLFQAELAPTQAHKARSGVSSKRGAAVRVIDSKRANNGGIVLARLKMTHDEMADAVDRIDDNALTSEQMQNIIEYLPTSDERKALECYMLSGGTDAAEKFDGLCECEKFMVAMMTVKYAKRKVRALLFKLQYSSCLHSLVKDATIVETACDELSNSVRLRKLLGIVLNVGNRLNTAGVSSKQRAGAFKLESLLKLSQAKAFDKTTTFLHYIILVVQRNNELLLRFKDDLPTVMKADRVYWDQCVTDLDEVENQLENVRRIALHQARLALSYRVKKKSHSVDDDGESLSDCSMSLEEEVELLRATPIGIFTLAAIKKVSSLRDKVETTKIKFKKLLEYFGEEERQDLQPHELFNIMVTFCKDFEKAKEQVYDSTKKKMREDRKMQASIKGMPPIAKPPPISSSPVAKEAPLRISNHQPSISIVMKAADIPNGYQKNDSRGGTHTTVNKGNSLRQTTPHAAVCNPPFASDSHRQPVQADWGQPSSDFSKEELKRGSTPRQLPTLKSPTHDSISSMRQKAREQRHRISGRSSVSSSTGTSVTSTTTATSHGSIWRQPSEQSRQHQLSPRSSIRQRRRTEQMQTRGTGTEWPDTADQNMHQLRMDLDSSRGD